jgi:hypothetical protein
MLKCTPRRVRELLASGGLPGLKIGVSWVLPRGAFFAALDTWSIREAARLWAKKNPSHEPSVAGRKRGRPRLPISSSGEKA